MPLSSLTDGNNVSQLQQLHVRHLEDRKCRWHFTCTYIRLSSRYESFIPSFKCISLNGCKTTTNIMLDPFISLEISLMWRWHLALMKTCNKPRAGIDGVWNATTAAPYLIKYEIIQITWNNLYFCIYCHGDGTFYSGVEICGQHSCSRSVMFMHYLYSSDTAVEMVMQLAQLEISSGLRQFSVDSPNANEGFSAVWALGNRLYIYFFCIPSCKRSWTNELEN